MMNTMILAAGSTGGWDDLSSSLSDVKVKVVLLAGTILGIIVVGACLKLGASKNTREGIGSVGKVLLAALGLGLAGAAIAIAINIGTETGNAGTNHQQNTNQSVIGQ